MTRIPTKAGMALAALGLALALGACSSGNRLEDKVAGSFKTQLSVKNVNVKCPANVKTDRAGEFDCRVTGDELSTIAGDGTNQATAHVVLAKDGTFTVTELTPANGPNSGINLIGSSGPSKAGS